MKRFALLLLAAPLALAACGSSSHAQVKVDPVAYVKHAATNTADQTSEHMTMTGTVSGNGPIVSLSGSGDFSNVPHQGSFVVSVSAAGHTFSRNGVLDSTTLYLSTPVVARSGGKKWIKFDVAKFERPRADNSALQYQTPSQLLGQLGAAGTVTRVGGEMIAGIATTHFHVDHLDVSKLPQGATIEAFAHPTYGPIDVWIGNANGYVHKETLSYSFTVRGMRGSQTFSMTMTAKFSKFGEAVHITVPPASQTVEMP